MPQPPLLYSETNIVHDFEFLRVSKVESIVHKITLDYYGQTHKCVEMKETQLVMQRKLRRGDKDSIYERGGPSFKCFYDRYFSGSIIITL